MRWIYWGLSIVAYLIYGFTIILLFLLLISFCIMLRFPYDAVDILHRASLFIILLGIAWLTSIVCKITRDTLKQQERK